MGTGNLKTGHLDHQQTTEAGKVLPCDYRETHPRVTFVILRNHKHDLIESR